MSAVQPDLFEPRRLARANDPHTSHAAATGNRDARVRQISRIWNALLEKGPMHYRDIATATGLEPVQVNRRGKEMEASGLVAIGPETRDGMRLWRGLRSE